MLINQVSIGPHFMHAVTFRAYPLARTEQSWVTMLVRQTHKLHRTTHHAMPLIFLRHFYIYLLLKKFWAKCPRPVVEIKNKTLLLFSILWKWRVYKSASIREIKSQMLLALSIRSRLFINLHMYSFSVYWLFIALVKHLVCHLNKCACYVMCIAEKAAATLINAKCMYIVTSWGTSIDFTAN